MCHRAGRVDADPLESVGAKDITAQVDFTAMADAGISGGCDLLGFATQERFLVNCGILQALSARADAAESSAYARLASGAHKILAPHEMGDLVNSSPGEKAWRLRCADSRPATFATSCMRDFPANDKMRT